MQTPAKYDSDSMKPALALICMALCCSAMCAQALNNYQVPQAPAPNLPPQNSTAPQGPVPISEEPHHRLVLQNDFARVYNVTVPPLDTTFLHQHDVPYIYVTLGAA